MLRWWLLPLLLGLASCAHQEARLVEPLPGALTDRTCFERYQTLAATTLAAGVADRRHQRVPGAPFLRSSRFFASFDPSSLSSEAYRQWLDHQDRLAVEGLMLEWQRLTDEAQGSLSEHWPSEAGDLETELNNCGERLVSALAREPARQIEAGTEYEPWRRVLGGYPLLFTPFYRGVVNEHETLNERQHAFARLDADTRRERWARFAVAGPAPSPAEALERLSRQPRDALGIPKLDAAAREALLAAFRPDWALERQPDGELAHNDRPLRLEVDRTGDIVRNTEAPTVYTDIDYGRYRGRVTLRLSYHLWLDGREPTGTLDLLAGDYNGVTWRVHLLPEGGVVGYDKVHQCGCWYQFFPARGFQPRPDWPLTQEPVRFGRTLDPHRRHTLWLASNTHHLEGVTSRPAAARREARALEALPYDRLRALPGPDGRTYSLFDSRGMVPGSERPERFLFWPMGIPNPGALRIQGRHAIAFIGRRHFDDPWLLRELGLE